MKGFVFAVFAAFLFASPAFAHGGGGGAFIFVFVGGGGPMSVPESTIGDYSNIHKIGILSAIGTNFDVSWNNGDPVRHDISVWKIDDMVRATLEKYLSSKYELSDLPFDGQAIAAINKHWFRERDTLNLLGTFTNPGVDAYLIVRPADGTLPGPAGLGIGLDNSNKVLLWTNFEIDLIDAHKLSYIGKAYAQLQVQEGMPPAFAVRQPPIPSDRIWTDFNSASVGPVAARIHQELEDLLPNALVSTLRSLKMGIDLPPIGDHTVAAPADAEIMAHVRSVAIVSAIGQSFDLVNPGVGFFVKKTETTMPVADAGIDDAVEAIARAVLSKHYVVKSIPADRAAIARTTIVPGFQLPTFLGLTRTNDVDAYILIVKAMRLEAPYGGLGVLHVTPLVNHTTSVFADYGIVVVDARNLRSVVGTTGAEPVTPPCPKTDLSHSGQASPLLECAVDESYWPSSGDTLTPEEVAKVRSSALSILSGSIPETLFHLGLDQPDDGTVAGVAPTQSMK